MSGRSPRLRRSERRRLERLLEAHGFASYAELAGWLETAARPPDAAPAARREGPGRAAERAPEDGGPTAEATIRLALERLFERMLTAGDAELRDIAAAARAAAEAARAGAAVRREQRLADADAARRAGATARGRGLSPATEEAIRAAIEKAGTGG